MDGPRTRAAHHRDWHRSWVVRKRRKRAPATQLSLRLEPVRTNGVRGGQPSMAGDRHTCELVSGEARQPGGSDDCAQVRMTDRPKVGRTPRPRATRVRALSPTTTLGVKALHG